MWNSPSPMNTSKIHLNVEKFSLKTNWKLSETVTKAVTKIHTESGRKGTEQSGWDHTSRRGLIGKGRIHQWRSALITEQFEPHIGCPSPGIQHRAGKPPWLAGGPLELTGGLWEAWTPFVRSMRVLACSQGRADKVDWGLFQWLPGFLWLPWHMPKPELSKCFSPTYFTSQLSTRARATRTRERAWPWNRETTWTWGGIWCNGDSHCWCLLRQITRSSPDLWQQLDHHSKSPDMLRAQVSPTCREEQLHNRAEAEKTGEIHWLWGTKETQVQWGCHYWQLHRHCIKHSLDLCLWLNHHSPCLIMSREPAWAPLAPALLPSGTRVLVLGDERAHT